MPRHITKVHITSEFKKSFRKLPAYVQKLAINKDQWFRKNAFDSRLKTHKLKGELKDLWAYSVTQKYRILFRFITREEVIYYDIGTHEIYR